MPEKGKTPTDQVRDLYDTVGWTMVDGVTFDAHTAEDLRPFARAYVSDCRLRVLRHIPESGERLLDMASGPVQYPEYLKYSENFSVRVCVDLSQRALDMAKAKLGARGEYHTGDFLNLKIAPVDAAISLHTIYHIDRTRQEAAVRKLIGDTKPGGRIVIIYSNPGYFISVLFAPMRKLFGLLKRRNALESSPDSIYFYRYPLGWWKRFADLGEVSIYPWRTLHSRDQRALIPNNRCGAFLLRKLFAAEERYPRFFCKIGCYPMIVIRKRP